VKLKEILRASKARTMEALDDAICDSMSAITAEDAVAWIGYCGHEITAL
jgi:hypothetical protein